MPHRLNITLPIMEIDWNAQWPNTESSAKGDSSDLDWDGLLLSLDFELSRPNFLISPFCLDEQNRSIEDNPFMLGNYLTGLMPASAATVAVPPHLDGILWPTSDLKVGKSTECKASSPRFKQRSNGKRSRVHVVNNTTELDSSGRLNAGRRALPSKKMASTPSHITAALTGKNGGDDGKEYSCHIARHNQVEKNYRNRLNVSYARLLDAVEITTPNNGEGIRREDRSQGLSKGNILGMATKRLLTLEAENQVLNIEVKRLKEFHF